jgi:hypothetical protein
MVIFAGVGVLKSFVSSTIGEDGLLIVVYISLYNGSDSLPELDGGGFLII